MVRADLEYNPYLLETKVSFNGNPPRINSLIEKYQNEKLQTWVKKIPGIFYDEMNGYDFELDFSGTELDFEEVKQSFAHAGVGKDRVILFHKGELDSRQNKVRAIENLLRWLDETPNRRFDKTAFREENKELFEGAYPFVIVGGVVNDDRVFSDMDISIECVNSVSELKKTDLQSTPVLLYLDRKTVGSLQNSLKVLFNRPDVDQDQLFFLISPVLGSKMERVLVDLGVREPQIVESIDDEKIIRYLEIFPVTEFIQDSIKVFREQTENLRTLLEEENKKSMISNRDIHEKIDDLEDILNRLKATHSSFINKDNLKYPEELISGKMELLAAIRRWKRKVTKITKIEDAEKSSLDYELEVKRKFDHYHEDVLRTYSEMADAIRKQYKAWYNTARYNEDFKADGVTLAPIKDYCAPSIASKLMELRREEAVVPKEDFLGKLLKVSPDNSNQELMYTPVFSCEEWRSYAVEAVDQIAKEMNREVFDSLCRYYEEVSKAYVDHLEMLIREISEEKEQVSSRLSEDERLLQADNDWHTTLCDKLREIERA